MVTEVEKNEESEAGATCDKCKEPMMQEDGKWFCPHCSGEIDFMGGADE
jgi:Zn finger protein HypA/HybF involved in hydrogenase expression